jgi:predicted Zn finger-like uncharacterized protein
MNLACPECSTVYRLDPARIPEGGITTRCRQCATAFRVQPLEQSPGDVATAVRVDAPAGATGEPVYEGQGSGPETPGPGEGPDPGGTEAKDRAPDGSEYGGGEPDAPLDGEVPEDRGAAPGPEPNAAEPGPPEADGADAGDPETASEAEVGPAVAEPPAASPAPSGPPVFGPQDPDTRARRLARALVSDITVYNPKKWEESLKSGTLRSEFRDEILKSWDEYVEQVGESMAKKTPYFRDALNDILARGGQLF